LCIQQNKVLERRIKKAMRNIFFGGILFRGGGDDGGGSEETTDEEGSPDMPDYGTDNEGGDGETSTTSE